MREKFAHVGVFVGWILIVLGALSVAANLPVFYLLITGQVEPGKPYWVDDLAPTTTEALAATAIGCMVLAVGLVIKVFATRYKVQNNEAPGA
jgi:hypothetical protein